MSVAEEIRGIIINLLKLKPNEINLDSRLYEDVSMDSTEMVELAIALEKKFNVKLTAREIPRSATVSDLAKIIDSKKIV
ncbi:MAG: phosphopantetheine-binding protein [Candidatus Omnitrophota bacterium]